MHLLEKDSVSWSLLVVCLGALSAPFPASFPTNILCAFIASHIPGVQVCHAHLLLFNFSP